MNFYRRKPAVIEAVQFDGSKESIKKILALDDFHAISWRNDSRRLVFFWRDIKVGDWVVKEDENLSVFKSDEFEIKFARVLEVPEFVIGEDKCQYEITSKNGVMDLKRRS